MSDNLKEYYKKTASHYWDTEYKQNGYKVVHDAGTEEKTFALAAREVDFFLWPTKDKSESLLNDKENNPYPTFGDDFCFVHKDVELQKPLSECTVLDYGCGILGRYTFALSKYFKQVIGVDIASEAVVGARKKQKELGIKNVRFVQNDGLSIPLANNSVDFIFSNLVLQHIGYIGAHRKIIAEFARVLNSGGKARLEYLSSSEARHNDFFSVVEGLGIKTEDLVAAYGECGIDVISLSDKFPYMWVTLCKR